MPRTINDSSGNEIQVYSEEEMNEQKETAKTDAVEDFKKENPDKTEELETLQKERDEANTKFEEANKQLEGELDKDKNFAQLRKQKDDAETQKVEAEDKIKELGESVDEKIETAKKEIQEDSLQGHYNDLMSTEAGGDEDRKKKIELQYKRLNDPIGTKEQMSIKFATAILMAADPPETDALNTVVISSGGVAPVNTKEKEGSFSAEEKELGSKLELSEEDLKKYGN